MTRISPNDSLLRTLNVEDVAAYLEFWGWVKVEHPNPKLFVFQGPKDDFGDPLELILPRHMNFLDSYARIADVVNFLSAFEEIPSREVVLKIRNMDRDVLNIRILDTLTAHNSIPLKIAHKQIGVLKDLFAFSACSERTPRPHFNSVLSVGRKHSNHCQFGQTFEGSFGFTIESPIISPYVQTRLEGDEPQPPFERRVMERIIRGLRVTQEAVSKEDFDLLVKEYATAFNANMCQAIVKMSNQKSVQIEVSISWSPKIKPSQDVRELGPMRLENKAYSYLEAASYHLRDVQPERVTVRGKVIELRTRADPLDYSSLPRTIVISWNHKPGRAASVKVSLAPDDYRAAIEAHRNGTPVTVSGILEKPSSSWVLVDPVEFQVN
jgi:hypothetical protein